MKQWVKNIGLFLLLPSLMALVGLNMPATPRAADSLLMAEPDKIKLLQTTPEPRLVLIGGSNLSFGIVSPMLRDSLGVNPVNMGMHAGLGLVYMLDRYTDYIKSGDVVVIIPEYEHFFDRYAYGEEALMHMLLDVPGNGLNQIGWEQFKNIARYIPKYIIDKFNPSEYNRSVGAANDIYGKNSFNAFGDAVKHYGKKPVAFGANNLSRSKLNKDVFKRLKTFEEEAEKKGATVLLTYPGFDSLSYAKSAQQVAVIEAALRHTNIKVMATPDKYVFSRNHCFNAAYHLTFEGAQLRTQKLIADLKKQQLWKATD